MSSTIFFIADLHLGHKRILSFGQRPEKTLTEMHVAMVDAWNEKVKKKHDIVWVLGDVALDKDALPWLDKMNGQKRLILGNHDIYPRELYLNHFKEVTHFQKKYGFVMTHIPIHPCELAPDYRWCRNIHGHIHKPERTLKDDRYINVNVDAIGSYAPVALDEIRKGL